MFLTHAKLLALCIFISGVSTSPTAVSPNTPALASRHEPDNDCPESTDWRSRECSPDTGPRDWEDTCRGVLATGMPYFVWQGGECPEGTVCQNAIDDDDDHVIECVVPQDPGHQDSGSSTTPQSGSSSEHTASTSRSTSEFSEEVEVSSDSTASVSAMVMSSDKSFVLSPANIIVGKVHGKEITVCKGKRSDKHRTRECYPTGRFEIKKGQKIDFTWGMTNTQSGSLSYLISPFAKK